MNFSFGDSQEGKVTSDYTLLPPAIKKIINICQQLPDGKLLFISDMAHRTGYSYVHLKSIVAGTPKIYSIITKVVVPDSINSDREVIRLRRVFGNADTIEALIKWEKEQVKLKKP